MLLLFNSGGFHDFFVSSGQFFSQIWTVVKDISRPDVLDICLVAFVIYQVIKLLRDTRSIQLLKGLILLVIIYAGINLLNMKASSYLMNAFFKDLVFVCVVLFQPEIRHALENIGKSKIKLIPFFNKDMNEEDIDTVRSALVAVSRACDHLGRHKTGALIVFERETLLGDVIATGTMVDAVISQEIIGNIFYPKSPLHDGAAIVRNGKLYAAGCILPLTKDTSIESELGTRHRAAIGMSEQGDAIVVVVSEETGEISIAEKGRLERGVTDEVLLNKLQNALLPEQNKKEKKRSKK